MVLGWPTAGVLRCLQLDSSVPAQVGEIMAFIAGLRSKKLAAAAEVL